MQIPQIEHQGMVATQQSDVFMLLIAAFWEHPVQQSMYEYRLSLSHALVGCILQESTAMYYRFRNLLKSWYESPKINNNIKLFIVNWPIAILLKRLFKNAKGLVHPFLPRHGIIN